MPNWPNPFSAIENPESDVENSSDGRVPNDLIQNNTDSDGTNNFILVNIIQKDQSTTENNSVKPEEVQIEFATDGDPTATQTSSEPAEISNHQTSLNIGATQASFQCAADQAEFESESSANNSVIRESTAPSFCSKNNQNEEPILDEEQLQRLNATEFVSYQRRRFEHVIGYETSKLHEMVDLESDLSLEAKDLGLRYNLEKDESLDQAIEECKQDNDRLNLMFTMPLAWNCSICTLKNEPKTEEESFVCSCCGAPSPKKLRFLGL